MVVRVGARRARTAATINRHLAEHAGENCITAVAVLLTPNHAFDDVCLRGQKQAIPRSFSETF